MVFVFEIELTYNVGNWSRQIRWRSQPQYLCMTGCLCHVIGDWERQQVVYEREVVWLLHHSIGYLTCVFDLPGYQSQLRCKEFCRWRLQPLLGEEFVKDDLKARMWCLSSSIHKTPYHFLDVDCKRERATLCTEGHMLNWKWSPTLFHLCCWLYV